MQMSLPLCVQANVTEIHGSTRLMDQGSLHVDKREIKPSDKEDEEDEGWLRNKLV